MHSTQDQASWPWSLILIWTECTEPNITVCLLCDLEQVTSPLWPLFFPSVKWDTGIRSSFKPLNPDIPWDENQFKKIFIYFNWRTITFTTLWWPLPHINIIRAILILFRIVFNISLSTTKEDVQCRMINILRSGNYLNFHGSVTAFNIGEIYHLLWLSFTK